MERAPVTELHREAHRRMIRRNQLNTKQVAGRAVSGGHSSANSPLAVLIEIVASGVWRDAVVAVARQHVAGSPSGTAMSQACSIMTESVPAMIEELGSG